MPKRITILDPNGVEVDVGEAGANPNPQHAREGWESMVEAVCHSLVDELQRENPKLGTYTVTVKEVE
jgi:hypothetical protein